MPVINTHNLRINKKSISNYLLEVIMKLNKQVIAGIVLAGFSLPALANQINLNTASKDELLKGIEGLTEEQAEAIIDYREKEGVFVKVPELLHIGIGRDIIGPNYNKLTVGDVSAADKKPDNS